MKRLQSSQSASIWCGAQPPPGENETHYAKSGGRKKRTYIGRSTGRVAALLKSGNVWGGWWWLVHRVVGVGGSNQGRCWPLKICDGTFEVVRPKLDGIQKSQGKKKTWGRGRRTYGTTKSSNRFQIFLRTSWQHVAKNPCDENTKRCFSYWCNNWKYGWNSTE